MLSLIAAYGNNRVIGNKGRLPWHLPRDLWWFKSNTEGKVVIMGRKTFESIGHALPNRENIVVTSDMSRGFSGVILMSSLEKAMSGFFPQERVIIGGAQIYKQALSRVDRMYLTHVDGDFEGDAFFPEFDRSEWLIQRSSHHAPDEKNAYGMRFEILDRR